MAIRAGTGPVLLSQDFPVTHMAPSVGIPAPSGSCSWLLNMIPVDGYLRQRPPFSRLNSSAGPNTPLAQGQLWKGDGTVVTWVLNGGGTIYSFDWSTLAFTSVVSTANFTTAGITVKASGRAYWCVFNNTLVVNDGTNRPWTWDGTSGAGGLTSLSNAPSACYGRPTVYYAKLFFIKNSDRRTIVWSEENLANTGYEAGGYSNVWVLGQTTSAPLTAIHGTNDGLYYWRASSVGVIRGAVSTDFATSGVHDSVSGEHGCVAVEGVAMAGQRDIWFVNQHGSPCFLPAGGSPVELAGMGVNLSTSYPSDGFGYGDFTTTMSATVLADMRVVYVRNGLAWPFPTVWVTLTTDAGAPGVALVLNAETRLPVCWVKPFGANALSMSVLENLYDTVQGEWMPCYLATGFGFLYGAGHQRSISGNDQGSAGASADTTCRLVTSPMAGDAPLEMLFDILHLVVGGANSNQISGTAQLLTSRKPYVSLASTAQSWTTTLLATGSPRQQHLRLGFAQSGRWARVMVQTPGALGLGGFSVHDIRLEAIPQAVGLEVP